MLLFFPHGIIKLAYASKLKVFLKAIYSNEQ
jgi:hypothetical protein